MSKATEQQVRNHYQAQGYEVKISRADGYVSFRVPLADAIWKNGRYISEYRITDDGEVILT